MAVQTPSAAVELCVADMVCVILTKYRQGAGNRDESLGSDDCLRVQARECAGFGHCSAFMLRANAAMPHCISSEMSFSGMAFMSRSARPLA